MPHYSIPVKIVSYNYMNIEAGSVQEAVEKVVDCSKDNLNEPIDDYEYFEYDPCGEKFEVDENNKIIKTIKE